MAICKSFGGFCVVPEIEPVTVLICSYYFNKLTMILAISTGSNIQAPQKKLNSIFLMPMHHHLKQTVLALRKVYVDKISAMIEKTTFRNKFIFNCHTVKFSIIILSKAT